MNPRRLKSARLIREVDYEEAANWLPVERRFSSSLHYTFKESNIPYSLTERPGDLGVRIEEQNQSTEPAYKKAIAVKRCPSYSMESVQMVGMVDFHRSSRYLRSTDFLLI